MYHLLFVLILAFTGCKLFKVSRKFLARRNPFQPYCLFEINRPLQWQAQCVSGKFKTTAINKDLFIIVVSCVFMTTIIISGSFLSYFLAISRLNSILGHFSINSQSFHRHFLVISSNATVCRNELNLAFRTKTDHSSVITHPTVNDCWIIFRHSVSTKLLIV